MCAVRKWERVVWCDATHCSRASALQTRLLACADRAGGVSRGYMDIISCNRAATVPSPYHSMGAKSLKVSRFLLSSKRAVSLCDTIRWGKTEEGG